MASQISRLTTDDVPQNERAEYWRDLICDVFVQLDCDNVAQSFFGNIQDRQIGSLQLSDVQSSRHSVRRSRRQIAKSTDDYFLVSMQLSGKGLVKQDGREALLRPGDFALYDSTREYELSFASTFEQLVIKAPRSMLRSRIASPDHLTATAIPGQRGIARVAVDFVRSVSTQVHLLEPHEIERVSHNVIDVVASALGHSLIEQPVAQSTSQASHLIRIKMFISDHLRDPNLTRDNIASANGVSVRYLCKLFENESMNVSAWIKNERLEKIAADLVDPEMAAMSISQLAYGWGINNISHFCREFRKKYHVSPRAYRVRGIATFNA